MEPYLAHLRQKFGSAMYEIDPYVEVFRLRENVWAINVPCTHKMGDNWVYLVEGPERALCIDNGYGIGDLKGLCELLTGKEVLCAVTHSHGDHAGGNPQWDEIYSHTVCADILEYQMGWYEEWWNRFNHRGTEFHRPYYDEADVIPYKPYKAVHMQDHDVINLGGDYDIELIHFGGHAPGSSVFLDKKSRVLYSGDSFFGTTMHGCGLGVGLHSPELGVPHPECMGLRFYAERLRDFAGRTGEFDAVMPGHGFVDCGAEVVSDTWKAIQAILKDPNCYDKVIERHTGTTYIKFSDSTDVMYELDDLAREVNV